MREAECIIYCQKRKKPLIVQRRYRVFTRGLNGKIHNGLSDVYSFSIYISFGTKCGVSDKNKSKYLTLYSSTNQSTHPNSKENQGCICER